MGDVPAAGLQRRLDRLSARPGRSCRHQWKDLIDPDYKGKAAILDVPAIGIMDAALCFESADLIKYGNKGNMTKEEIDFTIDKLIELKKTVTSAPPGPPSTSR